MNITRVLVTSSGIRLSIRENDKEVARAYLYVLKNDLHKRPFGFIEDVFVSETERGKGHGTKILEAIILEAKTHNCYKLICTSRNSRPHVHKLYKKVGFEEYGKEFRMDFKQR